MTCNLLAYLHHQASGKLFNLINPYNIIPKIVYFKNCACVHFSVLSLYLSVCVCVNMHLANIQVYCQPTDKLSINRKNVKTGITNNMMEIYIV